MTTKIISGFQEIAPQYDALIVDLWGVTHNGRTLFSPAVDVFEQAKKDGKTVIFLSNAPRRASSVYVQLDRFGLSRGLYDAVVTSGETAWAWVHSESGGETLGQKCFHLGAGEKDANMRIGLDVGFVDDVAEASFILNTGPEDAVTTLERFEPLIREAIANQIPMVCANPDLSVLRGEIEELCAGAIAEEYERQGGTVYWFGKPWQDVYNHCLALLTDIDRKRVLCIGDSMRTDIKGARAASLDCLLVGTGLRGQQLVSAQSGHLNPHGLNQLIAEYEIAPTFACVALKP